MHAVGFNAHQESTQTENANNSALAQWAAGWRGDWGAERTGSRGACAGNDYHGVLASAS